MNGGSATDDATQQEERPAKVQSHAASKVVMGKKEDPRDEAFNRELALTVKKYLKPDFDAINSSFSKVDMDLTELKTSNKDIQSKLSRIIEKLG